MFGDRVTEKMLRTTEVVFTNKYYCARYLASPGPDDVRVSKWEVMTRYRVVSYFGRPIGL